MDEKDLRELEIFAEWLDERGNAGEDPYERGRYFGKAEGIRLVAGMLQADA